MLSQPINIPLSLKKQNKACELSDNDIQTNKNPLGFLAFHLYCNLLSV